MLEHFAVAFAAHASFSVIEHAFKYLAQKRPDLEAAAQAAAASNDPTKIEEIFKKAVGVIIAEAGSGAIKLDGAAMNALKGIKFDHQHGRVTIGDSTISAQVLVTGGSEKSTGTTVIGENTTLRSQGTSIKVGEGCSIQISGSASIKQT